MSRLLFAAARGARLQRQHFKNPVNYWEATQVVQLGDHEKIDSDYVWRIHPDDEHLQYGPISTALRKGAEDPPTSNPDSVFFQDSKLLNYVFFHGDWFKYVNGAGNGECDDELHRSLFLLILAEALANEGM